MYAAAPRSTLLSGSGHLLLRILLATYFIALSLGLIPGTEIATIAHQYLSHNLAEFFANTAVFIFSYLILMGVWLRPATLLLAVFILANSAMHVSTQMSATAMNEFWRDMALIGGLLVLNLRITIRETDSKRRLIRSNQFSSSTLVKPTRVAPLRKEDIDPKRTVLRRSSDRDTEQNIFAA